MKILYVLVFSMIAVMLYVVYKDNTKWVQPVADYAEQCDSLGGTTYMVRSTKNNVVLLCVDTDVFLINPQIVEK